MKAKESKTIITIRLDSNVVKELRRDAENTSRSLSNYIESLLEKLGYKSGIKEREATPEEKACIESALKGVQAGEYFELGRDEMLTQYITRREEEENRKLLNV